MQIVENKIKNIAIWGVPIMFIALLVVMYQSSRIRNAQVENSTYARQQRELSIRLTQMALKKMDTVILGQDSIFLLFKTKKP